MLFDVFPPPHLCKLQCLWRECLENMSEILVRIGKKRNVKDEGGVIGGKGEGRISDTEGGEMRAN